MQPTSPAAISGGWPSQAGKRAGWCGPEPLFLGATTRPAVFRPHSSWGLGLDGLGAASPNFQVKEVSRTAVIEQETNGVWAGAERRPFAIAERRKAPEERQHSAAAWRDARRVRPRDRLKGHPDRGSDSDAGMLHDGGTLGRVPPARGSLFLARGIVTEGRDPASRLRDLRGSVTLAKAGGVEPIPASPDAPEGSKLNTPDC
jgi:hypothetical protein